MLSFGGACGRLRGKRSAYKVLVGKPERKNHLGDLGVDMRIMLRWIFKTWNWNYNELMWIKM